VRPRLFPDEARFAVRLSLIAFGTELAAWVWLAALLAAAPAHRGAFIPLAAGLAALRALRPVWAWLGTRVPRSAVAFPLISLALVADGAALLAMPLYPFPGAYALIAAAFASLPALGDLAASCAADAITIERRAAAYSFLDVAQGIGVGLGIAVGASSPRLAPAAAALGLFLAGLGIPELRDRGTPRSAWPLALYRDVARSALGRELCALSFAIGGLGALALQFAFGFGWLAPFAGMIFAARAESRAPNAVALPQLLAAVALAAALLGLCAPLAPRLLPQVSGQLALLALGAAASALPASVARAAGEMERPLLASLSSACLFAGAAAALLVRGYVTL
jgi:hypothetical protein